MYKIKIFPDNIDIDSAPDISLMESLGRHGITLNNSCAGEGTCGKCLVILIKGDIFSAAKTGSKPAGENKGTILACTSYPRSDIELTIPDFSRVKDIKTLSSEVYKPVVSKNSRFCGTLANHLIRRFILNVPGSQTENGNTSLSEIKALLPGAGLVSPGFSPYLPLNFSGHADNDKMAVTFIEHPVIWEAVGFHPGVPEKKVSGSFGLKLALPSAEDARPDSERVIETMKEQYSVDLFIPHALQKLLSALLRHSGFEITVSAVQKNIRNLCLDMELSSTKSVNAAIALDIGTTTLELRLIDLDSCEEMACLATHNPQISYGEDVISRMLFCESQNGLDRLRRLLMSSIDRLVSQALSISGISAGSIKCALFAGNTTMEHIFSGFDTANIRRSPYIPVAALSSPAFNGDENMIGSLPQKTLLLKMPNVGAYVGGDIVAGIIHSGIYESESFSALIDLGTNGEIVIGNRNMMISCATSAGPCFEGGGIKWGMRAMPGAIQKVLIDVSTDPPCVKYETIDPNVKPEGICGSGILSVLSELLKNALLTRSGAMIPGGWNIINTEDVNEFVIVDGKNSASGKNITITENDIKNLMNSKSAIFAGFKMMLKKIGLSSSDLERIYISGGLGNALDMSSALMIGMIPDVPIEKFSFIGNSSIEGSVKCLLDSALWETAKKIVSERIITYQDLGVMPEYMDEYTAGLFFPHTDLEQFASVKRFYL